MQKFRFLIWVIALLAMVSGSAALHGQNGLSDALSRVPLVSTSSVELLGLSVATADFNNDSTPDGAVLYRRGGAFHIDVHFRFQRELRITFTSNLPQLLISALDVNHDGHPDLIVEEPFSKRRLLVWLNDGQGDFRLERVQEGGFRSQDAELFFSTPSNEPDSRAMAVLGKSRVRKPASQLNEFPAVLEPARFPLAGWKPMLQFSAAPKLLRGPPDTSLL